MVGQFNIYSHVYRLRDAMEGAGLSESAIAATGGSARPPGIEAKEEKRRVTEVGVLLDG